MDVIQEGRLESREEVMTAWTKAEALSVEEHQIFLVLIINIVSGKRGNFLNFQFGMVAVEEVKKR